MTLIEIRGRGGQLIERVRSQSHQIKIGRAFDNDVIVDDPYVSAHHLELSLTEDGWQVVDLETINGLRIKSHGGDRADKIQSGDQLRIGHTELRVYQDDHPVEQALQIDGAEARLAALGNHFLWPLLLVISCLVLAFTTYQSTFNEFKLLPLLQPALWSVLGIALVAAVLALMGRLAKHRTYFFAHLSIWFLFGLCLKFAEYCAGIISYNASSGLMELLLGKGLNFILLVVGVGASLTLATTLLSNKRFWTSMGAAALLLVFQIAGDVQWGRDFSSSPNYYARLQDPGLLWVEPSEEKSVSDGLGELLELAVKEMEKSKE